MELRCPHCQNPLTIEDQYAGQLMRCPTCSGTFQAPTLAPASNQSWVAPPPSEPLPTEPPPTEPVAPAADKPEKPKKKKDRTPAPVVEGDYSKTFTLSISGHTVLPWIAPVGFGLIVLLSFFPWHFYPGAERYPGSPGAPLTFEAGQPSLWQLSLGGQQKGVFTMFVVLAIFMAWPLSIVSLLISLKVIPLPPPLDVIGSFRSIIVGALALAGFVFFTIAYLEALLGAYNPSTLAMKLAFRIALLVAIAALMQFWLDRRQIKNLPPPQIIARF